MKFKTATLCAVTLMSMSAIGNAAPELSKGDAKTAISKFFDENPACFTIGHYARSGKFDGFPEPVQLKMGDRGLQKVLSALADAGILSYEEKMVEMETASGPFVKLKERVKARVYDLTDEGKKYYKSDVEHFRGKFALRPKKGDTGPGFCYGQAKLEGVGSVKTGHRGKGDLAKAYMSFSVKDKPEWARNPEVVKAGLIQGERASTRVVKNMKGEVLSDNAQSNATVKGSIILKYQDGDWVYHAL